MTLVKKGRPTLTVREMVGVDKPYLIRRRKCLVRWMGLSQLGDSPSPIVEISFAPSPINYLS